MDDEEPTLELPNGDAIEPGDVILFEGYPYRYVVPEDGGAFTLSPLYWGESMLDIPFGSRVDLEEAWGGESHGTLTEAEWRAWIEAARDDETFDDAELDAIADEVLSERGLLDRLRRAFR